MYNRGRNKCGEKAEPTRLRRKHSKKKTMGERRTKVVLRLLRALLRNTKAKRGTTGNAISRELRGMQLNSGAAIMVER